MTDAIVEYGTDINSEWSFIDGDIKLVSNKDNLTQAIQNRLNTIQDTLNLFYLDYGSFLRSYLGWQTSDETLEFVRVEIQTSLSGDPRLNSFSVDCEYDQDKNILISIDVVVSDGEEFSLNYVLNENGLNIQEV